MARIHTLFLSICMCFYACADISADESADFKDKIINGNVENQFPQVVRLAVGNGGMKCTGTLISPTVVLTAGHCIESNSEYLPVTHVEVVQNGQIIETLAISDQLMHSEWNPAELTQGSDMGLLYLSTPARTAPMPLDQTPPSQYLNQVGTIVGFGMTDAQVNSSVGVKNSVRLKIVSLLDKLFVLDSSDSAHRSACKGDSGGPLIMTNAVTGVASFVDASNSEVCIDRSYYTSVYEHLDWINVNLQGAMRGRRRLNMPPVEQAGPGTNTSGSVPGTNPTPPGNSNTGLPSQSGGNCLELSTCLSGCQTGDTNCGSTCQSQASAESINQFNALLNCGQSNQCQDASCYLNACPDLAQVCLGLSANQNPQSPDSPTQPTQPGQENRGSCAELIDCQTSCGSEDFNCIDQCILQASQQAWEQSENLWNCANQSNCQDWSCVEQFCLTELEICLDTGSQGTNPGTNSPPNQGTRNRGCLEFATCLNTCGDHQSCQQVCISGASTQAIQLYEQIAICYQNSCTTATDPESCLYQYCEGQIMACQNDF